MSGRPRVSVVLPFRDAAATLPAALDSITAQTLDDWEGLLIDDGSSDGSAALADARAAADPRWRLLRAGGGIVDALNRGIAAARAPLIARMDADDVALPQRLARQVAAFDADPALTVVACLVEAFPAAELTDGMRRYIDWLNGVVSPAAIRDALFVESPIAHPSAVIRTDALRAVGGYRAFDGPEDYDLWLRLLLDGGRAVKVPEVLLRWRESPRRLSRVDPRCHRRRFLATKLAHLPRVLPPETPVQIWGAGPTGRLWARALAAHDYPVHRFYDVVPKRWGRRIDGIPVQRPAAPDPAHGFLLAAAGTPGAREQIQAWFVQHGLRPWEHFLAVA
ncbi:glycosyltransferase [bacterium]|nr:glycosyltransferase [bacterium]